MLNNINAVIFDLDGTLIDSMWIWRDIDVEYMKRYNLRMPEGFEEDLEGKSFTETAQFFLDVFPELPRTIDEVKKDWTDMAYESYTKKVSLKKGAYNFLQFLKRKGIKCGIATSNGRELVNATLDTLGITDFFGSIRTACEVAAGKPAPDVYLEVAKDLQMNPENCLVFEDIPNGILAGKNAGMAVCAIDDEFSKELEYKKRKMANYYIYSYDDVLSKQYEVLL